MGETEAWSCTHQRIGQDVQPIQHHVDLSAERHRQANLFDQEGSPLAIGSSQCMLHGFDEQLVLLIPGAGAVMELGDERGMHLLQTMAQHLGKQVMVAIPLSLVVQWKKKQVGTLQMLE